MADLGINNNVQNYSSQAAAASPAKTPSAAETNKDEKSKDEKAAVDTVEINNTTKPDDKNKIKNPFLRDNPTIEKLKSEAQAKIDSFQNLVENLFKKQGVKGEAAKWDGISPLKDHLQKAFANGVNQADVEKAQKDIAEGGYWSVEKTGDRILDFAKALIGDDMSKFGKIKDSILKGFGAAQDAWGSDKMPQITKDTLDYVTKKLDEWEKSGSTSGNANSIPTDATGLNK